MDDLTFWNRVAESSPLIVLILLGGLMAAGRMITELYRRLMALQVETLAALRDNTVAMVALREAVQRKGS